MNSNSSKMVLWGHEPTIFSICWLAESSCYSCPNNSSLDLLARLAVSSTSLDSVTVLYARCWWWGPAGDLGPVDLMAASRDTYRSLGAEPRDQVTKHRDCHRREDSLELKAGKCRPEAPFCGTSKTPRLWGFRGIRYRASLSSTPAFEFNQERDTGHTLKEVKTWPRSVASGVPSASPELNLLRWWLASPADRICSAKLTAYQTAE